MPCTGARGGRHRDGNGHLAARPGGVGPDYKLYLSPEFVETEAGVQRLKVRILRVCGVKTFERWGRCPAGGTRPSLRP